MEKCSPLSLQAVPEAFKGRHCREWMHAKTAILGRDEQPLDSEGTTFFPGVAVENAVAVVLNHVVVKLLAGETADRVQQLSLLVRPGKVHRVKFSIGP